MELVDFLRAFILGIVEGATEFIPVSSTGHLIIVSHLLDYTGPKAETFNIFIQMGAILAVVVLYRQRFINLFNFRSQEGFSGFNGLRLLALTSIPILIVGFLGRDFIKQVLFSPGTVAIGLIVGGVALVVIERVLPKAEKIGLDSLTWREAMIIGLFQCLALWPGVSRAASTIVGGMLLRVERKTAAEFSFFAAVPALTAATIYDLLKSDLQTSDIGVFAFGFLVAFIFGLLAVRFFIRLLSTITLAPFGWYRIAVGLVVGVLVLNGFLK